MRLRLAIPEEHVHPAVLDSALEAVTRLDERMIREGVVPTAERGIQKGVRWQREPPGEERFDNAQTVMGRGWGDCDDLAPWHAASLRVTGEDPGAVARVIQTGPYKFHAMVQRSDGRGWEDPSAEAGMPTRRGISPAVSGVMVGENKPAIALRRGSSRLWHARADLPWRGSGYRLSSLSATDHPIDAISQAIAGVCCVGESSGVVDRDHVARLLAVEAMARGADPNQLMGAFEAHGVPFRPAVVGDLLDVVSSINAAAKEPQRGPAQVSIRF